MTGVGAIKTETFEIPCKDGLTVRGEVYPAESSRGSVIICHGFKGFAHWAFFPYLARTLAQEGLTAITFDFSGSGIGADREDFLLRWQARRLRCADLQPTPAFP